MEVLKWFKKATRRLKGFLPIVEGHRVHFTRDALIFVAVTLLAFLTAAYILGFRLGEWLSTLP